MNQDVLAKLEQRLGRLHVADLHRRVGPDPDVEKENVVLRLHRLADAWHVRPRLGADDGIPPGTSAFIVEMVGTGNLLRHATQRRLLVLDEIGRGTSTYERVSIAWAVVESLHNHPGLRAKPLFATHYHELTQLTEELAHARNCNVAVREEGHDIIFLYRLEPGGADRSYGIHVGRLAGLPPAVVERARGILTMLEAGDHVAGPAPPPPAATAGG